MSDRKRNGDLDLAEHGKRNGKVISLDRRLYLQFMAFGDCTDVDRVREALAKPEFSGALYLDVNDPRGIGVAAMAEDPEYFVTTWRACLNRPPFRALRHRRRFDLMGRTYAIGYESDLEAALLTRPRQRVLGAESRWVVWYPLQRSKAFYALPAGRRMDILREHGSVGRRFGAAGFAVDVRLACHGLDREDNDFVIGLLGPNLHPLSAVVQEMRSTEQTSQYLDRLGPFFVGRTVWQSPA